jgi:transcriptional regulator with XRE-family HTH domain
VVIYLPCGYRYTTLKGDKMFGNLIKELRLEKEISLREFCRQLSLDASNWSKIERGLLAPPQDEEKLMKIAEVLGVKIPSEKYSEIKDKAALDAGIIPKDILSDKEVLNSLPMFFRTIRNEKPTKEELEKLIESIRRGE